MTIPPRPSFDRFGDVVPDSPVVLSVPHAGREYPGELLPLLRVPPAVLTTLEDRHVDAVAKAARGDHALIVARRARAWIDLNRAEHERDPAIDDGADPRAQPFASTKVRSGLGLVPRRAGRHDLWRGRFAAADIARRIADDHRPYHAAIRAALDAARARFGIAVLLDIHSMPPLPGQDAARVVLGDRFGRSAGARFVARAESVARGAGLKVAVNSPYAGGHILDAHADPARGIHAIQLELDRSLYLDPGLDRPGAGFEATIALVAETIAALEDEALPRAAAAE